MSRVPLPVIVGFGGINGAGRASGPPALARMAYAALGSGQRATTLAALAQLMGVDNPSA